MATEIERKFLVLNEDWKTEVDSETRITQAYLATNEMSSSRVRIHGDKANINIKSATLGITRSEFEYEIPLSDAQDMIDTLCLKPSIDKIRYFIKQASHCWEIDVFKGENEGLVVAEIELTSPDEEFEKPSWLGEEVSDDPRYYNVCLVQHPFKDWK